MTRVLGVPRCLGDNQCPPVSVCIAAGVADMNKEQTQIVTLDLMDDARYAVLVNALQTYANDALEIAQEEGSTTAERDHFRSVAATATELLNDLG